ncbi:MAG: RluA family pseudouridine synthase [Microscillaceae bacterium]
MKKIDFESLLVWEDEDYMVVNKPPFLSTLDDRREAGKANLIGLARQYLPTAQVGHRLDRETSGALAIAKNPEAYRHLALQFEHRQVTKIYHALADGLHRFEQVEVDKPILKLNNGLVKIDHLEGKSAQTFFQTREVFQKHTLIECRPITGRMHQIRIHLAVLKAPIAGDAQYGGQPIYLSALKKRFNLKKDTDEQPLMPRVALHAFALAFERLNGEKIVVETEYPKDLRATLTQLRKAGGGNL